MMGMVESKLHQIGEALSSLKLALQIQISSGNLAIYFDLMMEPHRPAWFKAHHKLFAHRERLKCFISLKP